ncbi:unnamed protein product [Rangifer tarandus platyrhynchus]|uniref:Uncharacterized protein n=1 Tax=Rangifer tarandus platyrhynchus TaxID=3082113 RepID=A0AC59YCR4_RANTA
MLASEQDFPNDLQTPATQLCPPRLSGELSRFPSSLQAKQRVKLGERGAKKEVALTKPDSPAADGEAGRRPLCLLAPAGEVAEAGIRGAEAVEGVPAPNVKRLLQRSPPRPALRGAVPRAHASLSACVSTALSSPRQDRLQTQRTQSSRPRRSTLPLPAGRKKRVGNARTIL